MRKNYLLKMIFVLMFGLFGLINANAQFLANTRTVNVVEVGSFDGNGEVRRYLADIEGVVTFSLDRNENSQWYEIPAGGVSNGTEDVQAYYYKNVATGKYLCVDDATLDSLENKRTEDWPLGPAKAVEVNAETDGFKWFYRPGSDWPWAAWFSNAANIDTTARAGNQIYTLLSITMMNGEAGGGFGGINYPDVAVGGFAGGYPGNAWSAVQKPAVVRSAANPDWEEPAPTCLDLDNLTMGADKYDAATRTITYTGAWQHVGWEWTEGEDFSEFNQLEVTFNTGGITGATDVEFCVSYVGGNGDGDYIVNPKPVVKDGMQTFTVPIGKANRQGGDFVPESEADATKVWRIGTKNGGTGTLVLESLCFGYADPPLTYSIDKLNFFATDSGEDPTASSYDQETKTITYNKGWSRAGWNFEPDGGLDVAGFDQIILHFDATGLTKGEAGSDSEWGKLQFDVEYMDGTKEAAPAGGGWAGGNEYRANADSAYWNITQTGKKVKLISLKSEREGTVVLESASLYKKPIIPVDLTITSIRWEPANPVPGDSLTFYATVKNNSEFDSPADVKHGVVFNVTGSVGATASWADGFRGPIAAGESIEISSRGEGSTGALWEAGTYPEYIVKAQVNDTRDVKETDYDNNLSAGDTIRMAGSADLWVQAIATTPKTPAPGNILFKATIYNIGTLDTPKGVKHGVAFSVNGQVVSWSDTWNESIQANPDTLASKSVVLNANGGPDATMEGYWVAEDSTADYTVTAFVNDDQTIKETNRENNVLEIVLHIKGSGINDVNVEGSVYVDGRVLVVNGYSTDAVLEVYNFSGQKIADVKTLKGSTIMLSTGTYIVKVQDKGKTGTHKVLVK